MWCLERLKTGVTSLHWQKMTQFSRHGTESEATHSQAGAGALTNFGVLSTNIHSLILLTSLTLTFFCHPVHSQGLYCDIRQLVQFIKEAHGNVFRRVALSALLDSAEKVTATKKPEEKEDTKQPGPRRYCTGQSVAWNGLNYSTVTKSFSTRGYLVIQSPLNNLEPCFSSLLDGLFVYFSFFSGLPASVFLAWMADWMFLVTWQELPVTFILSLSLKELKLPLVISSSLVAL